MKIINAKVYTEEGIFEKKDVYTDGELISGKSGDDEVLDAEGCYLIPGLTDIHFHGCVGHDFCDGTHESIEAMAMYEASQGITTIVPATMTLGEDTLQKICEAAASYRNEKGANSLRYQHGGTIHCHGKKRCPEWRFRTQTGCRDVPKT